MTFDLTVTFATIGFIEAVVKPIATRVVRRRILKWAPIVLDALDPVMPEMVSRYNKQELEEIVRRKFEELTGEEWTTKDVAPFWVLYDPRANSAKLNPSPSGTGNPPDHDAG